MRSAVFLVAVLLTLLSGCASIVERPVPLTRAEIVQMAQSGEPAARIIERLQATRSVIFLSASDIVELNRQGVPAEVLDWLQREQLLELRRRDAFDDWLYASPFNRCVGWPGRFAPRPFALRSPFWQHCL